MNIKIISNHAGIFARVMLIVQTIRYSNINVDNVDTIYLESKNGGVGHNLFNYVIDQEELPIYDVTLNTKLYKHYNRLTEDSDLITFKSIFNKIKIKDSILNMVDDRITNNTLGVHIRLTDMNSKHGKDYGVKTFDDYLMVIDRLMGDDTMGNMFISSDNSESISKISNKYNIITNQGISNRHSSEVDNGDYNKSLRAQISESRLWEDSFLDMVSLSKCGVLIKNVSSLSNTSIIVSDTINKVWYI